MKLSYLGITCESQLCHVETIETHMHGQFLGCIYTIRRPIRVPEDENVQTGLRSVCY
ncbi:MAG: hypothetical protein J7647_14665 [Cyanobacteria bacterium SBLK]|nr:hypothetical protein [Cyanobacteria bacterium SBLK]